MRSAEYQGTFSIESESTMRTHLVKTVDRIVEALTRPLESPAPSAKETSRPEEPVFKGTLEEVNTFFHNREWSDGLPIMPPTIDKVKDFLRYADRPPHEQIVVLPPGNLVATPWNIAVNGIMAGCQPKHMPVLVAAVEAIADPAYNLEQIGTTGGLNPFLFINGPIIKQLGIKYGVGLTCFQPNTTIGRALGLIIRNIAGLRPARQRMGTFGYFIPFVLAEDEEGSPWEPYHVEHGFARDTSTVTAGGTFNWGFQAFPSGTDPEGMLKMICRDISKRVSLTGAARYARDHMVTVLITPSVARAIAAGGYTKQRVEDFLCENTTAKIEEISFVLKYGDALGRGTTLRETLELGWDLPTGWDTAPPDQAVPILVSPETIHIVVCGDPTRNKEMALYTVYCRPATKQIRLPANW